MTDREEPLDTRITAKAASLAVAIAFLAVVVFWGEQNAFAVLALLPAAIGCFDQIFAKRRFEIQRRVFDEIANHKRAVDLLEAEKPSAAIRLASVLFLTAVLELAAVLSDSGIGMGRFFEGSATSGQAGVAGLVWAAYGAEVNVLWNLIARLNGNAVSNRFFLNAAIRASIAMILGFTAGATRLFGEGYTSVLCFCIGVFTAWAYGYARSKSLTMFHRDESGINRLPLSLLDGVTDETIGLLEEVGVSDIQHLATSDTAELAAKTLFPVLRVVDWVDQAILITYVRKDIEVLRKHGMRGALDLSLLLRSTGGDVGAITQTSAAEVLQSIATGLGVPYSTVYILARSLKQDRIVSGLYDQWQRPDENSDVMRCLSSA